MRSLPSALKKTLPLIIVLLLAVSSAGVFFLRSPVLIVTDASFNHIYGAQRLTLALVRNSLELFRRLVFVPVYEQAGPDIIALVVERAARSPYAVLFPQRYVDGARIFRDRHPHVPVLVMWGRNPLPQAYVQTGLVFVRTDSATDLYRAGLTAAALVPEAKKVLFFVDGTLEDQYREAFREGLRNQGFSEDPVYVDPAYMEYLPDGDIGCVVLLGLALEFLEQNPEIPVILFSWIDPALTPRSVRIVFDDSPPAVAVKALRAFSPGAREIFVPSRPTVLSDRIEERSDFAMLRGLIQEIIPKN